MIVESSAPGKLVISGEYAVLLGAPALVLALDRRIHVRLAPGTRQWHVIARGYDGECRHPLAALQATTHLPPADPAAMLQHVLGAVGAAGCDLARLPPDLEVEIDSRAGFEAGHKLGIGTSAAVCVALTAAVLARIGVGADPLPMALAAHRRAQGGRGSGLDVAASAIGGLIRFEAGSGQVDARRVTWPAGVAAVAIWTGSSADTPDYIDRFDAWRAGTVPAPLAALVDAAGATAAALPDAGAFMRQLRAFAARLRAFDEAAALGIHSRAHRRLHLLAPDGVVYKPCGAGGGDLGVACAVDASVLAAFVARAVEEGYSPLPLELEQDGVQVSIDR